MAASTEIKMRDSSDGTLVATPVLTVATLPAAGAGNKGARAFVTDGSTSLILGLGLTVAGSGSNNVPVYSNGTNWLIG